jgi:hypothetical protein
MTSRTVYVFDIGFSIWEPSIGAGRYGSLRPTGLNPLLIPISHCEVAENTRRTHNCMIVRNDYHLSDIILMNRAPHYEIRNKRTLPRLYQPTAYH